MKYLVGLLLLPFFSNAQNITNIAGSGSGGDGSPAISASIYDPAGIIFDKYGAMYIASGFDDRIRKIGTSGIITTVAGIQGSNGYSGDGRAATTALLNNPECVVFDTLGNLFFSDAQNNAIRKIDVATGIITTICGNGSYGYGGDNGPASAAVLYTPNGICFDKSGNLYIADGSNNRIRKINSFGIITTFAGTGTQGFNGDGEQATAAQLSDPIDVKVDKAGNIYIADGTNRRIRKVNSAGVISTYAGNGTAAYIGDGMAATSAQFVPGLFLVDMENDLFIADPYNYRVYKIDNGGIFHLIAGNGTRADSVWGGPATAASISSPCGLALDTCNNLYVSVVNYNRVCKVEFNTPPCAYLGVPDVHANIELSIYPNPAYDVLNVNGLTAEAEYALVNITGVVEQQGELKEGDNTLNVQSLPSGLYILEMTDDEGNKTVNKIIKE